MNVMMSMLMMKRLYVVDGDDGDVLVHRKSDHLHGHRDRTTVPIPESG